MPAYGKYFSSDINRLQWSTKAEERKLFFIKKYGPLTKPEKNIQIQEDKKRIEKFIEQLKENGKNYAVCCECKEMFETILKNNNKDFMCKKCYTLDYQKKNREKINGYQKKYRLENRLRMVRKKCENV